MISLMPRLIAVFLLIPLAIPAAAELSEKERAVSERLRAMEALTLDDWRIREAEGPHLEDPELDDSSWSPLRLHQRWPAGTFWLRRWVEIPATMGGYDVRGSRLRLDLGIGSEDDLQLRVFFNGSEVAVGDDRIEPILLAARAEPGKKILVAVKAISRAQGRIRLSGEPNFMHRAQILAQAPAGRPDPGSFRAELLSAQALVAAFPDPERQKRLDAAFGAVDFSLIEKGDQAGFENSLRSARAELEALKPWIRGFSIRAVGNAHIDMAWLWPWTETVEVVRNTFGTALQLMREYPDFVFAASSARAFAWLEEKYPPLFEDIRRRVREGRFEVVGGMWVEPDLNMPDGESLVRQLLVGKRYFREKLGVDVRVGWNPDSFGYSWQLPQIYKKSGIDYFLTQKMAWNDTNQFPHKLFWWQSPDGSRVLTFFPHDYVNFIDPVRMANTLAHYAPKTGSKELLHLYGVGDHGGGATRAMLDDARRWQDPGAIYPRLQLGTALGFFDDLRKKSFGMDIPVWNSELYFEYHRGVLTTQAQTKRRIRRSEAALLDAEKFSSLASLYGRAYPQAGFEQSWKRVLFDHFHDIMPGSGIAVNYVDSAENLEAAQRQAEDALRAGLEELAGRIDTRGLGEPLIVFNPLAWERTDVVETEIPFPADASDIEVQDGSGRPVPAELVSRNPARHRATLRFIAPKIPSLGYSVFHAVAATKARAAATGLSANGFTLENEFLRVVVDPKTGCIRSIFDKMARQEALAPGACGNQLQAFYDKPKDWDAWNIDADFEKQKWELSSPESVELVENGRTRAAIRVVQRFQKSRFVQDIALYPQIPRVDVSMQADWNEKHILLKVAFPVSVSTGSATYEIPFGSIERPTTRRDSIEKAKFEVAALRWADLSDERHGLSLLNDSKYGYDGKDNVLRLSLLRSPEWPDPHADEGRHRFTYALYPHAGGWRQAHTVRRGYELNVPLLAAREQAHEGALPPSHSFVSLSPDPVVLTTLKKAEDGDELVFRFYESQGNASEVTLNLPPGAVRAHEIDLMEREWRSLPLSAGSLRLPIGAWEIKSVKVGFGTR